MLLVETKLVATKNSGIALFADQDIPRDTMVFRFDEIIDRVYDLSEKIPYKILKSFLNRYGWVEGKKLYLAGDDARFIQHSKKPNLIRYGKVIVSLRNIKCGEELTENYDKK